MLASYFPAYKPLVKSVRGEIGLPITWPDSKQKANFALFVFNSLF